MVASTRGEVVGVLADGVLVGAVVAVQVAGGDARQDLLADDPAGRRRRSLVWSSPSRSG